MNLDIKSIKPLVAKLFLTLKNNALFLFIIIGLTIIGFLVIQVKTLANQEPSEDLLLEKMGTNKPVRIDEESVNTIKKLQEVNVEVKALFEQGRTNPFQD